MIDPNYLHYLGWCIQQIDNGQIAAAITDPEYGIQDNFETAVWALTIGASVHREPKHAVSVNRLLNHWKIKHLLYCLIYNEDDDAHELYVTRLLQQMRLSLVKELEREIEDSNGNQRRDYRPL